HYSVVMTLIATLGVALYVAVHMMTLKPSRDAAAEQLVHEGMQRMHLLEAANGVQALKLFNRSAELRSIWTNRLVDQFNAGQIVARVAVAQKTLSGLALGLERIAVIWIGAHSVLSS